MAGSSNLLALRRRAFADALKMRGHRLAARRAGLLSRPARLSGCRIDTLHVGDAEAAREMARGTVRLAGGVLTLADRSPWAVPLRDRAMVDALHGFDWFDDAVVAGRRDFDALRGWLLDWSARHGQGRGTCWTPALAGRRVIRFAPAMTRLLDGVTPREARRLRRLLTAHVAFLSARLGAERDRLARAEAATGLVIGALCMDGRAGSLRRGCKALGRLAAESMQADGGADRRPDIMAAVFVYLAWTCHALEAAGHAPEPAHAEALTVLGPAIRSLRLGDGGLPRFHGGVALPAGLSTEALDVAFALAGRRARGPRQTGALGYERLAAGRLAVIVDADAPPRGTTDGAASTLGMEIALGRHRLAGSIGPGTVLGGEWPLAARATAAHSTVEIEGASAARLAPDTAYTRRYGRPVVEGPSTVQSERSDDLDGLWFRADHDGYLARFGLMVSRRLHLAHTGVDFEGEDTLTCPSLRARQRFDKMAKDGAVTVRVRLHLSPDVDASTILNGRAIQLRVPDGAVWIFRGTGGSLSLVEGAWIDTARRRALPTLQVVLSGEARAYYGRLTWSLSRADEAAAALRVARQGETV